MKADELGSLRPHLPPGYTDGDDTLTNDQGPAAAFEVNKFMKEIMKYTRSNVKNKASQSFLHYMTYNLTVYHAGSLTDTSPIFPSYFWRLCRSSTPNRLGQYPT